MARKKKKKSVLAAITFWKRREVVLATNLSRKYSYSTELCTHKSIMALAQATPLPMPCVGHQANKNCLQGMGAESNCCECCLQVPAGEVDRTSTVPLWFIRSTLPRGVLR